MTAAEARTERWELAKRLALSHDIDQIEASIYIPFYHSLKRIVQDHPLPRSRLKQPCGKWYWGPTGTGKSYKARQDHSNYFIKPVNRWWDGYCGEDTVILEDIGLQHLKYGYLLKIWADIYPFAAEMKGTTVLLRPNHICCTSNYSLDTLFFGEELLAIKRRFTVIHLTEVFIQSPAKTPTPPTLEIRFPDDSD